MTALDTRKLYGCGPNGAATIYGVEGGTFVVEVSNDHGHSRVEVSDMADAYAAWLHPFDRDRGLNVPEAPDESGAYIRIEEHYLYVALESVEAGDSDTPV